MKDTSYYVYIYFRYDGSPCYVGKGKGRRWSSHIRHRCSNPRLRAIIKRSGGSLPIVIIRGNLSNSEAKWLEREFIKAIGRGSLGPLVNMTDGGDGTVGWKMPTPQRELLSQSAKRRVWTPEARENARNGQLGRKHSKQTKQKISASTMGRTISDAHKAAVSKAHRGQKLSLEHRALLLAAARRKQSPSQIIKRIDATLLTKAWLNLERMGLV